jgi:Fe-Mn family superoxide dismutase
MSPDSRTSRPSRPSRRSFLSAAAVVGAGVSLLRFPILNAAEAKATPIVQAPLPFAANALEPYISAATFGFHYGKHHKAYVDKGNELLQGSPLATKSVVEIIQATAGKTDAAGIFNNVAQAWNHEFFWKCLKPKGGGEPTGALADAIRTSFGSFEEFRKRFVDAGMTQFGSGWAWLVKDGAKLAIAKTPNAEHAYYLDYQNRRKDFFEAFLTHLVNWDTAIAAL